MAAFIIGSGPYLHGGPEQVVYLLPGKARRVPTEYFTLLSGVFSARPTKLINTGDASARALVFPGEDDLVLSEWWDFLLVMSKEIFLLMNALLLYLQKSINKNPVSMRFVKFVLQDSVCFFFHSFFGPKSVPF